MAKVSQGLTRVRGKGGGDVRGSVAMCGLLAGASCPPSILVDFTCSHTRSNRIVVSAAVVRFVFHLCLISDIAETWA